MYNKLNKEYGYLLDNINGYPLDKYQRKVVFDSHQNTIVIAGAGSGKTTTIIGKIIYLTKVLNYKEEDILCISFTNESVNSLKKALENNNISNINVKTFHKLSLDILNNKYKILDYDLLEYILNEIYLLKTNEKQLIKSIINLYKCQNLSPNIFYSISKKYKNIVIKVLEIMILYNEEKKATNSIDYDDMITLAANEAKTSTYKYIIIDEFQDSSLIRIQLIKKLISINNAKLLVVGDDWQSIYRFAGSDINLFLNFKKHFKKSKTLKLVNTYRNSQQLISIAGKFIAKNSYQIVKKLKSPKDINKPIKIVFYSKTSIILEKVINIINQSDILVLGRNSFNINKYLNNNLTIDNENLIYKDYQIKYLTIHKSKGLEANNVIILDVNNYIYGIPSLIKDEKIISYFKTNKKQFKYDEERRLFYVALTRTKNHVYLLVNKKNPSIFIKELLKDYSKYIDIIFS